MKGIRLLVKLNSYSNFWPLLAVVFFALLAGRKLIGPGYFVMHDDLQMMRQLQMEKCFLDLQIPCRWSPDMGFGFGYPLFNYYPPLPYLIGQGIRLFGFAFVEVAKILFWGSFIASGITMYFLAKEFFGRLGGMVSAVFYVWAPYHAVDVFVRGAMNEAWALIWFPMILFSGYRLIRGFPDKKIKKQESVFMEVLLRARRDAKWISLLSLSWFALFTSHNLMVIIFTPIFALWILLWMVRFKSLDSLPSLILSGVWAFGLSAFFILPVLLERGLVQTGTLVQGYYNFTVHYISIKQLLFSRFWGYGPSVWGVTEDRMSFQIGWLHWIIPLVVAGILAFKFLQRKKVDNLLMVTSFMLLIGWFSAFMTHNKSTPIWLLVRQLEFVQFPWRFLTVAIMAFSFIAGALVKITPKLLKLPAAVLLTIAVLAYSWSYFQPEGGKLGPLTDEQKFSGLAWEKQQTAGIFDYLPITAQTAPKAKKEEVAVIVEGDGRVISSSEGTDWARATLGLSEDSVVRINILEYPSWAVTVDGHKVRQFVPKKEEWGRMYVNVPAGEHEIEAKLSSTTPRTVGNLLSVGSWIIFLSITPAFRRLEA